MAENGFTLGTAWIQISPSMKGLQEAIRKELAGTDTKPAEKKVESGLGAAFKRVAKAGALALGAVSGIAAAAGFADVAREALNASDATDKFKSTLGFAGVSADEIGKLTASTKKYADDTVYELSDIQNITAQLAANGVQGYDRLAEAAGNLNAVAGGNAETFKSVGMVLTQTAGQGKLTTENWNQLADAIPGASGKLQEALLKNGAYTGDFRDAMAKGEITAEEFNQAILDLGFTDAAEEAATSTTTIEGAWGNLQATLVTGAMGIVDKLKPALTDFMGSVSDGASKAFGWINDTAVPSLQGVWDILTKGDFTGPIFGFQEDSGLVDFLFNLRDAGLSVWDMFKSLWDAGSALGGVLAPLGADIAGAFAGSTVSVIQGVADALKSVFDWMGRNKDVVAPLIVVVGTAVGTFQLLSSTLAAVNAVKAAGGLLQFAKATNVAKAAQLAFNAVMSVGPIGLIAVALAALVAGLTYFFTQTETGRQAWAAITDAFYSFVDWVGSAWSTAMESISSWWASTWDQVGGTVDWFNSTVVSGLASAWQGIQDAIGACVDWLNAYVVPVFQAVWDGIKTAVWVALIPVIAYFELWKLALQAVADFVVTYVWPYIQTAWEGIQAGATMLWGYMQEAWAGIQTAVQVVADWIAAYVLPVVTGVWDGIVAGANLLWTGVQMYWQWIQLCVQTVADWFTAYALPVIQAVWDGINWGAQALWQGIQTVWWGIQTTVLTVADWFTTYVLPVIQSVWDGIRAGANSLWASMTSIWNGIQSSMSIVANWMYYTLWGTITSVTDGIKSAFQSMKDSVASIWESVKGVVAKPINFIINTVYAAGIKKTADGMAEKLGLSLRLPYVAPIAEYASGGVLPGYTPGRDVFHFFSPDGGGALALSGGEAIMRPEWVRAVGGPGAVARMNAAARSGSTRIPGGDTGVKFAAFANGGIWDGAQGAWDWIKDAADTMGKIIADPAGAVAKLIKAPVDAMMANLPGSGMIADSMRAVPGVWIDGFANWLKGKTSSMGATGIVNAARKAIGVPYVWGGSSIPPGLDCSGLVYWAAHQMGSRIPRLTAAGYQSGAGAGNRNVPGNLLFWGNPAWHVAIASGNGMMVEAPKPGAFVRETGIWGSPTAGTYKFDNGGYIQPGLTTVLNETGRPEPVFTDGQWDILQRHARGASYPETLVVVDEDGQLVGRMRVEARGAVNDALSPASRSRARDLLGMSF